MRKASLRPMDAIALAISQEKTINTDNLYGNTTAKFGRSNAADIRMSPEQGSKLSLVMARVLEHKGELTAVAKAQATTTKRTGRSLCRSSTVGICVWSRYSTSFGSTTPGRES